MTGVISTIEQVTPEWLTNVLHRENALPQNKTVTAIQTQPNAAFNSRIFHLKLIYSEGKSPASHPNLLLKCNLKQAWAIQAGAREVTFYQTVRRLTDHPPVIVRCYDAVYDTATGDSHLLLEDLSKSHVIPVERDRQISLEDNLPSDEHLQQAVDVLARFHAYWWENPQLQTKFAPIGWASGDETQLTGEIQRRRNALEYLLRHEGSGFPLHLKTLYETILQQMPHLWKTYMQPRLTNLANLTLTHGDAYLANFLCPREGRARNTYLIDWQSPEIYRGASDLVNMCVTFWTRTQRSDRAREQNILRQYHLTLVEHGVTGYSWRDLVTDYQCSIVDWLLIPLQDYLDGAGKAYWWPKIRCLSDAFEDWNCTDLFAHA